MLRAACKLISFVLLVMAFFIPLAFCNAVSRKAGTKFLQHFYKLTQYCWSIRVEVQGQLATQRPLLLVSNHCSYLDIPVIGALAPLRFTPKSEVRDWPVIGQLCKMASCVFIDRRREKTSQNRGKLLRTLQEGAIISLFPEGTTNEGFRPLPFKSSFFSLAEEVIAGSPLAVQPISVSYFHYDGSPLSREDMDKVAWYGDWEFIPHLWDYCKTRGVLAKVEFLEAQNLKQFADRKALAKHCETVIINAMIKKERLVAEALPNNGG